MSISPLKAGYYDERGVYKTVFPRWVKTGAERQAFLKLRNELKARKGFSSSCVVSTWGGTEGKPKDGCTVFLEVGGIAGWMIIVVFFIAELRGRL